MRKRIQTIQRWAIAQVTRQAKQIFAQELRLLPLVILLVVPVSVALLVPDTRAAGFDVNHTGDVGDANAGNGNCDIDEDAPGLQCTLRAAVEEANALTGPDTIYLTIPGPYTLEGAELTVTSEIILNGNGQTISAGGLSRIFVVSTGGNLSLNDLTLRDGRADAGGGILIDWGGAANILNSAIFSNTATTNGGGINNFFGTLNITNSTISGNHANDGGGIIHFSFGAATANLTNVTVAYNRTDTRGGGISAYGPINLKNTLIAKNSTGGSGPDCDDDPLTPFITTEQYNLIGNNTGCAGTFPPGVPNANSDLVGTNNTPLDPLLGDLTGSPAYHPLLAGSPAIDKIPAANCPVDRDQPGAARPQGAHCDIGAVEVISTGYADLGITKAVVSTAPVAPGDTITYTLTFSNSGPETAMGVVITDRVPITLTGVSFSNTGATITSTGTFSYVWDVADLAPGEGGIITITGRINSDLTGATTFTNTATITTSATDEVVNDNQDEISITVIPEEIGWYDICVSQRMEITGIGLGDRHSTINPQTISLADPASVNWLLAQMAGRGLPVPDRVTFTTDAPQSLALNEPGSSNPYGYTFEAKLQPTGNITVSVSNPGDSYKTPRGLVLYGKRAIADTWTSVGKTTNNYAYRKKGDGTHTEVLTFPSLEEMTDLFITAVVIDNDDDSRPMVLEAVAGGVVERVTEPGPTNGQGLNIVNLTLSQVLTGTGQVSVTLRSPSDNGDSLVLVGLNVGFPCAGSTGAILHVVPSPATISLGATGLLTITVTPGSAEVNGVQIHGRLDPAYLRLVDVRPTDALPTELDPVAFDPATGEFRYGAGLLGDVITKPFAVLVLEVQAMATTTGTLVEFLDDFPPADISGPNGSVMAQAQDGLVIIMPGLTLQGTVDMQGRPPKPASSWAIPLTVSLTPAGSNTLTHTYITTTDKNCEFELELEGIAPGLYDVRVKGNHTLRSLAPDLNLTWDDNRYFFDTLLEGDVETVATFNRVVQTDVEVLIGSFNICYGQSGFAPNADLDESSCVLLPDFGLLSGNFGKEGDIVVFPTPDLSSSSIRASNGGALMTFSVETMEVAVGEVVTLTIEIDPRGQPVNGGMAHLSFDPHLVEIEAVTLTDFLSVTLVEPAVDNQQGEVRFAAGILGQTITEKFPFATLSVKVKAVTAGATITPVDLFATTDVSGPQGSVLAEATGITLRTETQGQTYLPIIMK